MRLRVTRLTAIASAVQQLIASYNPGVLFANNEQGVWYDPPDIGTLFQDNVGTAPVTSVEQPVGLMLDKSKGLILGPELVVNGGFDANINGWVAGSELSNISWVSGKLRVSTNSTQTVGKSAYQPLPVVAGRTYKISGTATLVEGQVSTTHVVLRDGVDSGTSNLVASTVLSMGSGAEAGFIYTATTTTTLYLHCRIFNTTAPATVDYDNISARELPGNHATQVFPINRPVLSARVNLLTGTNDISAFIPTNTSVSDSVFTVLNPGSANITSTFNVGAQPNNTLYTFSVKLKKVNSNWIRVRVFNINAALAVLAFVNLDNGQIGSNNASSLGGTAELVPVAGEPGSYRLFLTVVSTQSFSFPQIYIDAATGDGVLTCNGGESYEVGQLDLRVANDGIGLPPYQRINTTTDYDAGPEWPRYLRFNGTNSWMQTASIDFTGTDKMTVWAGVRKMSDAAAGVVAETSVNSNTNNGSLLLSIYGLAGSEGDAFFRIRGTTVCAGPYLASAASPNTYVQTLQGNIAATTSGAELIGRYNGSQITIDYLIGETDAGTGNFGNYPLFIGARAGTSLWLNGRLYSLVVRGAQSTTPQVEQTEIWINNKTKAY